MLLRVGAAACRAACLRRPATAVPAVLRTSRAYCSTADDDINVDSVAYGFMASQAVFTALELGTFNYIAGAGEAGLALPALQKACGVAAPRLQTLLTALVSLKALRRDPASGAYTNSPNTASFLVQGSKLYYGDYLRYQMGRQFYHRMGALPDAMTSGEAPSYQEWFSDPHTARTYTHAQHNGSVATAKYLVRKKLDLGSARSMLDVGGGSGAFSYVFCGSQPELTSTVLELPGVCETGERIRHADRPATAAPSHHRRAPPGVCARPCCLRAEQPDEIQRRVSFVPLDATSPDWPVAAGAYDVVLMSYICGSVPEPMIQSLYANAYEALAPGGRLLVHDFMARPPTPTHETAWHRDAAPPQGTPQRT